MDKDSHAHPRMDWMAEDLPTAFKSFQSHCEFMFGGPLKKKDEEEKCNYLMLWVGEKGRSLYSTWNLSDENKKKLESYYQGFEHYCRPKSNAIYSRYKFKSRVQDSEETFEQFVTDLRILIKDCGYPEDVKEEMIRDHIVFGVHTNKVREKLISEGSELTLQKCIDIGRTYELSQRQLKSMNTEEEVHMVKKKFARKVKKTEPNQQCTKCGYVHRGETCPAEGKQCILCKQYNHFASVCRNKQQKSKKKVHVVEEEQSSSDDEFFIGMVYEDETEIHSLSDSWTVQCTVNKKSINMQVDTGARCNVICKKVLDDMKLKTVLEKSAVKLRSYSGHTIVPIAKIQLPCKFKDKIHCIDFQVIDNVAPTVLGSETCQNIGLIKRMFNIDSNIELSDDTDIRQEYADIFKGLGCVPGKYTIHTDPSVQPVIHPPRRVPEAIRDKVKQELLRMETEGIIERQTEPTEWVNSMVTVSKPNGSIRICLDPKDLNKAIRRPHFPMLTIEEVVLRMPDAKYLSKIDATSGFWQIQLDEKSSKLCTFNSPFGRFRFKRLPFGINAAPEIFQSVMTEMISDVEGAEAIVDDILVWGSTLQEHDTRLRKVLNKARQYNLKLSADKCEFRKKEIHYVGHVLSENGLKPDPEKIRAVEEMSTPKDKKELKRFLGFIQYIAKFMPNLSDVTAPLRQLLGEETEWHWEKQQEDSFKKLKNMASSAPVLAFYDVKKPIVLTVDSSQKGMGAAIVQEGKPVAFASRALTPTQERYSQIEKETLAIVYGCTKFHQYIYGRKVLVESDHKPLQIIFRKSIHSAPARLQRLLMALQKYELEIKYVPGKEMILADTLSRAYLQETKETLIEDLSVNDIHLLSYLPVTTKKYEEIKRATMLDPATQLLQEITVKGWPEDREQVPETVRPYWNHRDEIASIDGLLFKGEKLIIPESLRKEMLMKIHQSHLGIAKCKSRAREAIFWPGMSKDIEEVVRKCDICAKSQNQNAKEPMKLVELPDRPWSKIAVDLFEIKGQHYLLSVDYYSKWPEVARLDNLTSSNVVTYMKSQFSRYGIPDEVVSDNGPQFTSTEFANFTKKYGFLHTTSSPYFAQANGQAERMVQTVKRLLKKSQDPYIALLDYRDTQIEGLEQSPAQMFLGRRLKSTLPVTAPLLKSQQKSQQPDVSARLKQRQLQHKKYFDRHARKTDLKPLQNGESVMIQTGNKWSHGTVKARHASPRSYIVQSPEGKDYRRNRKHLRPTRSTQMDEGDVDLEIPAQPSQMEERTRPETTDDGAFTKTEYTTRSGREVRKPKRFDEYV